MNSRTRAVALAALLVFSGAGGLFVGGAGAAAENNHIVAADDGSGNKTTHNVSANVSTQSSLNGFVVDYSNSSSGAKVDLSNVTTNSVVAAGFDDNDDGVIDNSAGAPKSVDISENGTRVRFSWGGSTSPQTSTDSFIIRFENVTNPGREGSYDVTTIMNPDSGANKNSMVLNITDATPPAIENFTLTKSGQDVDLVVETDDQLSELGVTVSDDASKQLNLSAFNESGSGTDWTYVADVSDGEDGDYTATLDNAVDDAGNAVDNPSASDSLTVNTQSITVDGGNVTPDAVDSGTTASQSVEVAVSQASKDGEPETVSITFNGSVAVENATATADSTTVTDTTITDGNTTVVATVDSGDGGGTAAYNVTYDLNATYTTQGNTTVPLDAAAVDSDDGDAATVENVTSVYVRDATPPVISNFTLVTTGQDVDLTFDASEELGAVTVQLGDDAAGTLTLSELNATNNGGDWSYRGDVSDGLDGSFSASLDAGDAEDLAGNVNQNGHSDTATVNELAIDVVNATVTNGTVDPDSTVDHTVTVEVQDVSLDGEEDTVQVVVPAAAENVTLNGASADTALNGTSTTTNAAGDTVLNATVNPGDGGGVTSVNVTYDVTATYPDSTEGETYPLNASAFDSDGDADGPENHSAFVTVRNVPPEITNTTLFLNDAATQDVDLRFNSTEELATAQATFETDLAGTTLSLANGTLSGSQNADGTWTYTADVHEGDDGQFNVTVSGTDAAGNDAVGNRTDSLRVNETDPVVVSATVAPSDVRPGETATQTVTAEVDGFSREGGVDTVRVTLGDGTDVVDLSNVTVTDENGNEATISGYTVVDDGDGTNETVRIELASGDGLGTANVSVAFDATVRYADALEGSTLPVNATAEDSDGASDAATNLTQVQVVDTYPSITNFTLNATDQDVDLSFDSDEQLADVQVDLGGDLNGTLTESDLVETGSGDAWTYTANVSDGQDGRFEATLATAADDTGNDGAAGQSDSVRVNVVGPDLRQTRISPANVTPGVATNQTLTTNVTGLSRDGLNDTVTLGFPNESAISLTNVTVEGDNASVAGVTVNGTDVLVNVSNGNTTGTANVTLTTNVTATYDNSTEGETFNLTAAVNDSDGEWVAPRNVTQVNVTDTVPNVTQFDLNATGQDVNLTVTTNESVSTLNASLGGDLNETLTRENFTETAENGSYVYTANVSEGYDGIFNATLTNATDPYNNSALVGQNDSVVVDTLNVSADGLNATPDEVGPNETVDQTFVLNATNVSQDGLNDTATFTFENETDVLNASATVNGSATATTNVSDLDGDGFNETVEVALNTSDTLGTANLSVALNATASYNGSLEGQNVTVSAVVNDSDGSNATALTNVSVVDTRPNVTAFDLNTTGQDVNLTVATNESVQTLNATLGGDLNETLTRENFTETAENGTYVYTANVSAGYDGLFNATLTNATDAANNSALVGQNDSVVVDTLNVSAGDLNATPDTVRPNETVDQTFVLNATNVSQDGLNDTATFTFGNGTDVLAANATVDAANATATTNVSDFDTDGVNETVEVALNTSDTLGTANLSVFLNTSAHYNGSLEGQNVTVSAVVNDSDGSNASTVTNVSVENTTPEISAFNLSATGQTVNLTLAANESLAAVNVSLGGDLNGTVTRENLSERYENGSYVYTTNVSEGLDGTFNGSLANASDAAGNPAVWNASVDATDSVTVDRTNVSFPANSTTAAPDAVDPNETASQTLTVNVTGLSRDGANDTVVLSLNGTEITNATVTADGANATAAAVDADGDNVTDEVAVTLVTNDTAGTANVSLTVDAAVFYPGGLEGTTVHVNATVEDSDGSNASLTGATAVSVRDTVPNVSTFDVVRNGSNVTLTLASDERLETVRVALNGTVAGTLTRADFRETRENGSSVYTTTLADGTQGRYNATLTAAVDAAGNDGAANQTDEVSYWTGAGGGGGQQQRADDEPTKTNETEETVANSPTVVIEQVTDGKRVVLKRGATGLSAAGHVTADPAEAEAGVHLSDVRFTAAEDGTVSLAVTHDTAGEGVPALPASAAAAMFYHAEADGVTDTRYTFRVHEDRLGDRSPDEVTIYGTDGDEWTALDATYAGERGEYHAFTVRDDASTLAVALSGANVSVVDATVAGETVNASEDPANVSRNGTRTFVNVTVENTGPVAGNVTLNVTADGSSIATRTVTVEANSTRTVQVAGDVASVNTSPPVVVVEVNDAEAGVLPMPEDGDGSDTTSTDTPGFGALVALVALAAAALLARRD